MRTVFTVLSFALFVASGASFAAALPASPTPEAEAPILAVGTKLAPPFALRDSEGRWSGLSIELWRLVAEDAGLAFELEERDLAGLLAGVEDGSLDAAVAALTVTSAREELFDFTHPFHTSGLGIATSGEAGGWHHAVLSFLSADFFLAILPLGGLLLVVGIVVWLFERHRNDEFGGTWWEGLGSGFWWSAVTMTTVGYGDKSPRTFGGRLVGLVWMFASVIAISGFTATIATSLTLSSLETAVQSSADLPEARVATVRGSTSAAWLEERGIGFRAWDTPEEAVAALESGEVEAVVYDRPILQWLVAERASGLRILPETLERQDYGIALPTGSAMREDLNRAILRVIGSPSWRDVRTRYLGAGD